MKSFGIFALLIFPSFIFPDLRIECGTGYYLTHSEYRENIENYQQFIETNQLDRVREIMWVPVTFHIVRMDNGSGGLPVERIGTGLEDMNNLLGEYGFRFYQAGGIDFIDNSNYYSGINSYEEINELRQINQVANTLNIYATPVLNNGNFDLCGISTFSWYNSDSQGVVMANSCFATSDNHSTLSHEVGHYFNLYHTHQGSADQNDDGIIDGENAEYVDGFECDSRGDGLCDTPADPTLSDVVTGSCIYTGNYLDGHLDEYDPDTANLMSYSVKNCRDFVSPEQFDKMTYTYETDRPWLNTPPAVPNIYLTQQNFSELSGDGDDVYNPGETVQLIITIENHPDWPDAHNVELYLSSQDESLQITNDYFSIPDLAAGESLSNIVTPFQIGIGEEAELSDHLVSLQIVAEGVNSEIFTRDYELNVPVSLYQQYWPVRTLSDSLNQVKGVPVVHDLDGDLFPDLVFADYNGIIYAVDRFGDMIQNNIFPFSAGDSFWGDIAAADIDNDGNMEFVAASKDKHIYIIDAVLNELQLVFDSDQFLISAPTLGNMDEDDDLEIIFGGFSSSGKIFAINYDGTFVPGFPVQINEKIRGGVALADINGNTKADIITATESNHIWLIYDDGTTAEGFPFLGGDRFKVAPAVLTINNDHMILAGCENGSVYSVDINGNLLFSYESGAPVSTGFGFIDLPDGPGIFFGNENGELFGVDITGSDVAGWPVESTGMISAAPILSDINGDGTAEVISGSSAAYLLVWDFHGVPYTHFPIHGEHQFISSATVTDLDLDGDPEIIMGSTHSVTAIDIKESWNDDTGYWDTFQGNPMRTGHFQSSWEGSCPNPMSGDINCDGSVDVLDAVRLIDMIIEPDSAEPNNYEIWAADLNADTVIDILDAVLLVNLIIN